MIRKALLLTLLVVFAGSAFAQAPASSNHSKLEWVKQAPFKLPTDAKVRSGRVVLMLSLSETGEVTDAVYDSGEQALAPYAIETVKQWKAKPYLVDGKPTAIHVKLPLNVGDTNKK